MIIKIDRDRPKLNLIKKVAKALEKGAVVAYPTDTIYGLGCSIFDKKAIDRVYQIKRQEKKKKMSFVCSSIKEISIYAQITDYAYKVMKMLLPGPYTFILLASKIVPKIMLSPRKTVGVRVPDNKICLQIVKELGHPIITTSISAGENEFLNDPLEIAKFFKNQIDIIVDGGITFREPSTVVDLTEDRPIIIRKGKGDVSIFEEIS